MENIKVTFEAEVDKAIKLLERETNVTSFINVRSSILSSLINSIHKLSDSNKLVEKELNIILDTYMLKADNLEKNL